MRTWKLAIVLPVAQVLIAWILLVWADRTPVPPGLDYMYHPPAWLVCKGLNAPVMLLLFPFGGNWYNAPPVPVVGRGLFLISVAVVWYLVGRATDRRGSPKPAGERGLATILAVQSLLVAVGGVLFYAGRNEMGGSITGFVRAFLTLSWPLRLVALGPVFSLMWSVSLVFLSSRTVLRTLKRRLEPS
jgi:hypothetical protein